MCVTQQLSASGRGFFIANISESIFPSGFDLRGAEDPLCSIVCKSSVTHLWLQMVKF